MWLLERSIDRLKSSIARTFDPSDWPRIRNLFDLNKPNEASDQGVRPRQDVFHLCVLTPPAGLFHGRGSLLTRVAVLLVLQFPVSDARAFRSDREVRLDVPSWSKPRTDLRPEFVHFFGRAVERRRGADNAWTDEMFFCLAKRALRFNDLATRGIGPATLGF